MVERSYVFKAEIPLSYPRPLTSSEKQLVGVLMQDVIELWGEAMVAFGKQHREIVSLGDIVCLMRVLLMERVSEGDDEKG